MQYSQSVRRLVVICLLVLIFLYPWKSVIDAQDEVYAHQSNTSLYIAEQANENKLLRFADQAKEIQELVKQREPLKAREAILKLEEELLELPLESYVGRLDQANILLETVIQLRYASTRAEPDFNLLERRAMMMMLAFDALAHRETPMWLQVYPSLVQTINAQKAAIEQEDRDQFYKSLNDFAFRYEIVRPAIFLSHPTGVVEQIDSLYTHINENRQQSWQKKDHTLNVLNELENILQLAFFQRTDQSIQSFITVMLIFTMLICSVLAYVGWRKYKGEQDRLRSMKFKKMFKREKM